MALGSGAAEVGSCREPAAALLVVAGVVYVFWFGLFFGIFSHLACSVSGRGAGSAAELLEDVG